MRRSTFQPKISCICVGAPNSGKTLLLRKLQGKSDIDETTSSVPTIGTSIYKLKLSSNRTIAVRELGGLIAPLWRHYYQFVSRIIFVVDASNLCQISASGILLYTILTEPQLRNIPILLVLSKMDMSYRQMRNETLLMLQIEKLKREVPQKITIVEFSAINGKGAEKIVSWFE